MKVQLRVHVKGYVNDHDGYCSGNECSYVDIDEYRHFMADIDPESLATIHNDMVWKELEEIEKSYASNFKCQSFYCENDPEAISRGISCHDISIEFSDVELD